MTGRVISTKLKNTATVLIERIAKHPLYKKTYIRSKKYLVDSSIDIKDGDIVEFVKCKPISKNKHWKITKVLGRSLAEIAEQKLKEQAEELIAEVMPEEEKTKKSSAISPQINEAAGEKQEKTKRRRKSLKADS